MNEQLPFFLEKTCNFTVFTAANFASNSASGGGGDAASRFLIKFWTNIYFIVNLQGDPKGSERFCEAV